VPWNVGIDRASIFAFSAVLQDGVAGSKQTVAATENRPSDAMAKIYRTA
jgi:hypothetical protein